MTEPLDLTKQYTGGDYVYLLTGDGQKTNAAGKKLIDCSHMVNLLLTGAGYKIPYEPTESMNGSSYYTEIKPEEVKKGDIALWIDVLPLDGSTKTVSHTGIVIDFNPSSDAGKFFGAQSKKGPSEAVFGKEPPAHYWPVPTKFLRAKEEYRAGISPAATPASVPAPAASVLNFQYPFRKADGKQFTNEDEIFKVLEGEESGNYLLGSHKFWHGGIHISNKSAPQCVSDEPIRCIADGVVIAYRLNKDYLESLFVGSSSCESLKYTNSFCLVRHDYKTPPNTQISPSISNELTFYSLYMHLLPFEHYSSSSEKKTLAKPHYWQGKVRARVTSTGLTLRNAPDTLANGANSGAPIGASMALCTNSVIEFDSTKVLNLKLGGKLFRMAECTFIPSNSTPPTGLKNHDAPVPSSFWACVERKFVEWQELTPNSFDVVVPSTVKIKAGDPVGYLGLHEVPSCPSGGISRKHQVHLEVFTVDNRVDDFIKNKANLKFGKKFLHLPIGSVITKKSPETGEVTLVSSHAIDLSKLPIFNADWYEVAIKEGDKSVAGLIKKSDAKIITQHDWEKLGFQVVKENNPSADGFLDPENMPDFFKALYGDLDKLGDKDGKVTTEDFSEALKNSDFRDHWTKLIAYHPTEWKDKSDSPKWSRLSQLLEGAPEVLKHEKERIDSLVFWEDPALQSSSLGSGVIWHFHPIAMLGNFLGKEAAKPGQITYDAEGNDIPTTPGFTRHIHWPNTTPSGVTLGRGYDMGSRTESEIFNHMVAAGIGTVQATKISKAHGLKGNSAGNFVTQNRADIGLITLEQQVALFDLIYPSYVTRTINNYNNYTEGRPGRLPWDSLSQIVRDILVDFVYQGFTLSERPMVAGMKDDVDELISYIENTPGISVHEPSRQRAPYLKKNR